MTDTGAQRRHEAILELAAMEKRDLPTALERILATDAEVLDVERVNCWELIAQPRGIRCAMSYVRSEHRFESGQVLQASAFPRYFQAVASDPVILAVDAQRDDRTRELSETYLEPLGITSMMDVPVWVRGSLWGVICHEHVGSPRQWSGADRDFAMSVGHIVSMAIEAEKGAQAEELVRALETVMGVLGHELRNPLTAIRASAQHLIRRQDEGEALAAHRILRSAGRMTRMIDQLLDLTRIRLGGGLPIQRQSVDLAELSRNVVVDAETAQTIPAIDVRTTGTVTGEWDSDRLWQVMSNLLGNAIEHGAEDGPIAISIDGRHPESVTVTIRNRGAIEQARVAGLFEPFWQAATKPVGRAKGLGLGLFISREIVAAHGGTIAIDSDGDVTTATFCLPRR